MLLFISIFIYNINHLNITLNCTVNSIAKHVIVVTQNSIPLFRRAKCKLEDKKWQRQNRQIQTKAIF